MTGARILALTLWAEAAGRPVRAIEGLAALAVNRARGLGSVAAACRSPFVFACWHPRHPRRAAMLAVAEGDAQLAACTRIAARALAGALPDPTGGATHFHPEERLPRWAIGRTPCATLGGLVFYRPEA
ncbi:MAG TPA: cell wall hydrolase [Acetobacteraceae bacterium]|nr:cell wall hydrolase [Acetobacteraceae bacterium]